MEFIYLYSSAKSLSENYITQFVIAGLAFIAIFTFQAIALNTIGKREGYKHRWMAFVPILSTYYMGVCAQKNKVFNNSTKKFAIFVAIVELIMLIAFLLCYVCEILVFDYLADPVYEYVLPAFSDYFNIKILSGYSGYVNIPENLIWATYVFDYGGIFATFIQLVFEIMNILLVMSFFKTYSPRNYFIFTVVSIFFPITKAFFVFAVRNNKGKNYMDYIRAEQERQYKMRQQYYQQYYQNDPYSNHSGNSGSYGNSNGANPYNTAQNPFRNGQNSNPAPDDPFGDFSSSNGSNNNSNNSSNGNSNSQSTPPPKDPFDDF